MANINFKWFKIFVGNVIVRPMTSAVKIAKSGNWLSNESTHHFTQ